MKFRTHFRRRLSSIRSVLILVTGVGLVALYCEYGIYYIVAMQCAWSSLTEESTGPNVPLKALLIADPHLLGPRKGHWLDKWRREGQMNRAFQAVMAVHRPEVVFFLGDLFDEGLWSTDSQFKEYVDRFQHIFSVEDEVQLYHIAGNHDVGFHHDITPRKLKRFSELLSSPPVRLLTIRGNTFVLVNSMAMQGDKCFLCREAVQRIQEISKMLNCSSGQIKCNENERLLNFRRPILMQHFPLYRTSDEMCTGSDAAPLAERSIPFRNKIDAISQESTQFLIEKLRPRAVFGGHTHHGCEVYHSFGRHERSGFVEYSVPSFSWRNRPDRGTTGPKYFLVIITPQEIGVSKCDLPKESTIILTAVIMLSVVTCYAFYSMNRQCRHPWFHSVGERKFWIE